MYSDDNELSDALKPKNFGVSGNNVPVYDKDYLLSLTNGALDIVIQRNHFEFKDSLSLRKVSRSLKGSVNKTLSFKTAAFYQVLRNVRTAEFYDTELVGRFSSFHRAIIKKDKEVLKDYLREFFDLMLNNLVGHPEIACLLVQISAEMNLTPEDFEGLGDEVVTLFKFLTQPIKDFSEENEDITLANIVGLEQRGYTEKQCKDLEVSIKATFDFLGMKKLGETLVYKNLSGKYFCGKYLKKANLTGANLSGAMLDHPNLEEANLTGANLSRAVLNDAKLSRANLSGANLERADLYDSSLWDANLEGANLSGARCTKTRFIRANLTRANLERADLERADLTEANLTEANLTVANLTEANLTVANLKRAKLEGANLSRANLREVKLRRAMFSGANFSGARLENTEFFKSNYSYNSVRKFFNEVEKALELNPAGVLPLLLSIKDQELKELNKMNSKNFLELKKLSGACLSNVLAKISSVDELSRLFSRVSVKDSVFRTEMYPEVLTLIAHIYLFQNLSSEYASLENDFKTKLMEEICKQKRVFGFFNEAWNNKWNDLIHKINKAELKFSQSLNPQRVNQM